MQVSQRRRSAVGTCSTRGSTSRAQSEATWPHQFQSTTTALVANRWTSHIIRYDSLYLTCSKKLTGSQLSLPHGINKKLKCETKNKTMSMIGLVQSRCHEGSPVGKRSLRWEGFVEKLGFEPGVKEWGSNGWWEWWWWQRWADKWMRRWVETWLEVMQDRAFSYCGRQ